MMKGAVLFDCCILAAGAILNRIMHEIKMSFDGF